MIPSIRMSFVSGFVYSAYSLEIHPVVHISYLFLVVDDEAATSGICHDLFIPWSVDVHLGCFQGWLSWIKLLKKIPTEVFVWDVCFWWEEWRALTHVFCGHMTVALDRQGMEQNAPILSLLAVTALTLDAFQRSLPLGAHSLCSLESALMGFSIEPTVGGLAYRNAYALGFSQSIWHCMTTLPSICVNSKTARTWFAWGDHTRAGDLGYYDFCDVSGWAPV